MSHFRSFSSDLRLAIREILLREWDPIGVKDIPEAEDEYDAYVDPVFSLMDSGKGVSEIFNYLDWLERIHMGLTRDHRQATLRIAEKLVRVAEDNRLPSD